MSDAGPDASHLRPEERAACKMLEVVLGATFTEYDDGSSDRQVEGLFVLPDGSEGALEVTTLSGDDAMWREGIAGDSDWSVPTSTWAWRVTYPATIEPRELRRLREHLDELVLTCERLGVVDPELAGVASPAFQWFEANGLRMHGFPETTMPGTCSVMRDGWGGATSESLDDLPAWLLECFKKPLIQGKLRKLAATDRPHQHLFIRVHSSGMPFALSDPLGQSDTVPASPLQQPGSLTGLWLIAEFISRDHWTLLRWDAHQGWSREPLP